MQACTGLGTIEAPVALGNSRRIDIAKIKITSVVGTVVLTTTIGTVVIFVIVTVFVLAAAALKDINKDPKCKVVSKCLL